MLKILFYILLLCLISPGLGISESGKPYDVTAEYGPKLDRVSFKERFLFKKTMNLDWYKSNLEQRKEFLEQYHEDLVLEKVRKKEAKEKDIEKQRALQEARKERKDRELDAIERVKDEIRDAENALKEEKNRNADRHKHLQEQINGMRSSERRD